MAAPTEPPATAWLTVTVTTWLGGTHTLLPAADFTCPGADIEAEGSTLLNLVQVAPYASAPFTYAAPPRDSTIYSCGYLISDARAASPTSTSSTSPTATSSHTTGQSSHSTASATHSAATQVTHTKTNVGAIAGAAVGAAILGLIVGALICYLCLKGGKRRKRRDSLNNEATAMTTFLPPAPPPKERLSSRESVRNDAALLPSAADVAASGGGGINNVLSSISIHEGANDEEIKSELSALGYLLQEHVQNNYHLDPLDGNRNNIFRVNQALSDPAFGLDDRSHALILKLSTDPQTRFAAIRHFLALTIFSALDLHHVRSHPGSVSLLPRQVTSFLESIPSAGAGKNGMTPQSKRLPFLSITRWA